MSPKRSSRIASLDVLRGLLMVLMALDHANHFIAQQHASGEYWGGPFPTYDATLPFLTRFVTHLCAPGFFFLAGAGMVLCAHSRAPTGWSRPIVIGHFGLRGAVLVALELLVINQGWRLSPGGWQLQVYVGVLTALGATMILAGPLAWLEPLGLVILAAVLTVGVHLTMPGPRMWETDYDILTRLLLVPGGTQALWVHYPVLPWLAVTLFGVAFGHSLRSSPARAYRLATAYGFGFLAGFAALRVLGGFGNLRPRAGDGWMDILNVVKYPPALTYLVLTLGLNLLILVAIERALRSVPRLLRPLETLGRVPLFFYVLHLYVYAGLGNLLTPHGAGLPVTYSLWLAGVLILAYQCAGYADLKRRPSVRRILQYL